MSESRSDVDEAASPEGEGLPSADPPAGSADGAGNPPAAGPPASPPGSPPESSPPAAGTAAPSERAEAAKAADPPSYRFLAVVALVGAAIDLASKEWARHALHGADPIRGKLREIEVIPGLFDLQYAENPGGAWSMLRSLPEIWRRPFFLFVSTAASVFICSLYARVDRRDWAMKWGLPLALAGALGNLVDRVRHGIVVDFLHVYSSWGGKARHWPTFNVADVWIVFGVACMAVSILSGKSRLGHVDDDEEPDLRKPDELDGPPAGPA
jgi:signal peptidase II